MRIMRDSTNLNSIPATGADIIALYGNGQYKADVANAVAKWPTPPYMRVWIDVTGNNADTCQILDVEFGNATPGIAALWIQSRHKLVAGALPTIYCNRSTRPAVETAAARAGLTAGKDYWLWIATLDGTTDDIDGKPLEQLPGVVAIQWKGSDRTGGGYDESIVYADWWHCLPKPPAPAKPPATPPVTRSEAYDAITTLTKFVSQ